MKKIMIGVALAMFFIAFSAPSAHARSGCCSHHGGVVGCGCGDGTPLSATCAPYYPACNAPVPQPTTPKPAPKPITKTAPKTVPAVFTGKPKTYAQLYSCKVVGNYDSMIYHLKGSSYIKKMNLVKKECFATEAAAKVKGFRKSKN